MRQFTVWNEDGQTEIAAERAEIRLDNRLYFFVGKHATAVFNSGNWTSYGDTTPEDSQDTCTVLDYRAVYKGKEKERRLLNSDFVNSHCVYCPLSHATNEIEFFGSQCQFFTQATVCVNSGEASVELSLSGVSCMLILKQGGNDAK